MNLAKESAAKSKAVNSRNVSFRPEVPMSSGLFLSLPRNKKAKKRKIRVVVPAGSIYAGGRSMEGSQMASNVYAQSAADYRRVEQAILFLERISRSSPA